MDKALITICNCLYDSFVLKTHQQLVVNLVNIKISFHFYVDYHLLKISHAPKTVEDH